MGLIFHAELPGGKWVTANDPPPELLDRLLECHPDGVLMASDEVQRPKIVVKSLHEGGV